LPRRWAVRVTPAHRPPASAARISAREPFGRVLVISRGSRGTVVSSDQPWLTGRQLVRQSVAHGPSAQSDWLTGRGWSSCKWRRVICLIGRVPSNHQAVPGPSPAHPATRGCPHRTIRVSRRAQPPPGAGHGPQPARQPVANVISCDSQRVPASSRAASPACGRPARPGPGRPQAPRLADPPTRSSHSGLAALVLFVLIRAADSGPGPPARAGPTRLTPSQEPADPSSCRSRSRLCRLVVLTSCIASCEELLAL